MGKLFANLTNPGVQSPNGGTQFFNPGQVQSGAFAKALTPQSGNVQPSSANIPGEMQPPGSPQMAPTPTTFNQPSPNMPQAFKPSFQQAASMGPVPGPNNALSPGLNKAGKLVTLLTSGLQGAMAGRAAQEQTTAASGGRRSGGAGMGFQAGYELPWQHAMQGQQLEQAQAQTALTQAQSQMVPTPYGMMPAGIARFILPASIREQGQIGAAQIGAGGRQAVAGTEATSREAVAGIQAAGAANVAAINKRYMAVPNVGLYDTQTKQLIPGTQQGITVTPEIAADYQLPNDFIGKPMTLSNFSSLENVQNRAITPVSGANGPSLVNKQAAMQGQPGAVKDLGIGSPAANPIAQARTFGNQSPQVAQAFDRVQESTSRLNIMRQNLQDAMKGDQQAMLSLLANHLGMTMGLQKGARMNQAIINEAQQSTPWLQGLKARFDDRGYLTGVTLTPEQMRSMVTLGENRLAQDQRQFEATQQFIGGQGAPAQQQPAATHIWTPQGLKPVGR